MKCAYKNILVHNMVNLGDVVFSTACLPIIKRAYPNAKVTMIVRPKIADVLQNHPYLDEVIEYDYKSKGDRLSVFKFANFIKSKKFDLSISLDRKPRMAIITWLAGIKERIGPNKVFGEKLSWCTMLYTKTIELPYNLFDKHQQDIYQDIIVRFTELPELTGVFKPSIAKAPSANKDKIGEILSKIGEGPYIVLCVKAEFHLKNWLPERWAELIERLNVKYAANTIIVGTQPDSAYAQKIIDGSGVTVLNLCGKTSMLDLVAIYEQCALAITLDNGSAHVAAARDTKMVSIFGCTLPSRSRPICTNCEVVCVAKECIPCSVRECLEHGCMQDISVDLVMEKVEKVRSSV